MKTLRHLEFLIFDLCVASVSQCLWGYRAGNNPPQRHRDTEAFTEFSSRPTERTNRQSKITSVTTTNDWDFQSRHDLKIALAHGCCGGTFKAEVSLGAALGWHRHLHG